MNFLKKTWVAIALTVIMVVAAIGVGQLRAPVPGLPTDTSNSASGALDTSLSTSEYDTWISDQAGVLSSSAEEQISLYNANWDYRYNSLIAVLMVDSLDGQDIESYAYDQWTQIGLGQGDALLVAAVDDELYYVATGNDFSTILTSSVTSRLDGMLSSNFGAQRFEEGVLSFFAEMNQVYIDNFGLGNAGGGGSYQVNERTMGVISLLVLLVAALMVLSAIDRARYNSYRARFYGVASPPYVFRPILFWHGPGYGTGAIGTVRRRHRPEVREGPEDQVTPVDLAGSAAAAVRGAEDHVAAALAAAVVSEAPSAAAAAEASAVPAAVALVGASAVVAEASVAVAEASEVALAAAVAAAAALAAGEC